MVDSRKRWKILALTTGFLLVGCSHADLEHRLDDRLAREPGALTHDGLHAEVASGIEQARGLTPAQRIELRSLLERKRGELDAYREQSLRLRALLIQDVLADQPDQEEIQRVQERLRETESKRLSALFEGVREANETLGRWASRRERLNAEDLDFMNQEFIDIYQ